MTKVVVGCALLSFWVIVSACMFSYVRAGEGGGSEPLPISHWYFPVILEGNQGGDEEDR